MSRQQGRLRSPTPLAGSARFAMQYPLMTTVASPVGKPPRGHQDRSACRLSLPGFCRARGVRRRSEACNFRVSGHEFA